MAKVLPNGKLSGSIGGTTYATQPNGDVIARDKPTGAREKILYSPDCERSRENFTEFTRSIRGAMLLRHSLHNLIKGFELADSNLSGRVNSITSKILKTDSDSRRGERRIESGQLSLLTSFAFRSDEKQAFGKIFQAPLQHTLDATSGQGTLQLLPCRLNRLLKKPKHTTHIRLVLQVASIQFEPEGYNTQYTTSNYLSIHESLQQPVTLQTAVDLLQDGILVAAIGVVFYAKQPDGHYLELKGGVMTILEAKKVEGNQDSQKASHMASEEQPIAVAPTANEALEVKRSGQPVACTAQAMIISGRKTNRLSCAACVVPIWLTAGTARNEKTVDAIGEHVQQQADGDDACLARKEQQHVNGDGIITVQGMEANTTPARVKNRHGEQVVQVDEHGKQQDDIDAQPPRTVDQQGDDNREAEMKKVVNELLHARQNYS